MCKHDHIKYCKTYKQHWCADCLLPVKRRRKWWILGAIILFLSILFATKSVGHSGYLSPLSYKPTKSEDVELQKDSIYNEMVRLDIQFPEIAIKQVLLETGHFTSQVCKENKNLLGIKYIGQEEAIGENLGHAKYKTYRDCLKDYKRLQQYYCKKIDQKYSESGNYTQVLKTIK